MEFINNPIVIINNYSDIVNNQSINILFDDIVNNSSMIYITPEINLFSVEKYDWVDEQLLQMSEDPDWDEYYKDNDDDKNVMTFELCDFDFDLENMSCLTFEIHQYVNKEE